MVEKVVMQLEAQLADRNVTIELSSAAKEWLAERGYDRLYGARPLGRVIQEWIKMPLAEELLFGKLVRGGFGEVDAQGRQAGVQSTPKRRQSLSWQSRKAKATKAGRSESRRRRTKIRSGPGT